MENRTLTDADIEAIGKMIAERSPVCRLGLSHEEAAMIKTHLSMFKRARNTIGSVVLTALTVVLIAIFTKGFWASLVEGMKK